MPIFGESEDTIFGQILYDVVNDTNITRVSPGSKTRAIIAAVSKKLGRQVQRFDANVALAFLDGSRGKYTEFLGDMLGTPRLDASAPSVSVSQRNIKFYVDVGTFGDINGGSSILISSGTLISTGSNSSGIVYKVLYDTVLGASESEGYIAAEALRPGVVSNVGRRQLTHHNFSNYTDSLNDTLKVTNDSEISSGRNIESEANYKYRVANKVVAAEAGNLTSIRLAALSVPGVADVITIPFFRGVGSYDLLIKSTTPTVSDSLISAVLSSVEEYTSLGIIGSVRGPKELGISLTGKLTMKRKLSAEEQSNVIQAVTNNVTEYINSLDVQEDFIENAVVERVISSSELIKNIGIAGKPFESKYIYKYSKLEDNKVRSALIGDYSPDDDERVIVENRYAGTTPILFTIT